MNFSDNDLQTKARNLISNLKRCPQGHIESPHAIVQCMVKFSQEINNSISDKKLEDKAWDMILKLKQCSMGHIVSPNEVVNCMVQFVKLVDLDKNNSIIITK